MQHLNEIRSKEIAAGIEGKYIHGAVSTLGYVKIKAGSVLDAHHHMHEQITFILEGELDMTIGGEKYLLTTGTSHVIPSHVVHSAVAKTDCTVIDVFSPARDDYR